jgi:TPR repeat protein
LAQASRDYEAAIHAEARGDKQSAIQFYRTAAEAGHGPAQFYLGRRYETGDGLTRNDLLALDWYVKAAANGHSAAANNIGAMIATGRVGPRDRARALAWYLRASALGNGLAMTNIAAYYRNGYLVARDVAKDYFWEALAVRFGHDAAMPRMQRAMAQLSAAQRHAVDDSLQSFTIDKLAGATRDLRAVADLRDFGAPDRTIWNPAVAPIRFQFPVATAGYGGGRYGL